jgi:excisionase family DNA binding protein
VTRKLAVSIPRFALTPPEAAAAIGVGPDFFEENVAPELRLIRRGRKRLIPVSELERWVTQAASAPMGEEVGRAPRGMSADRATLK